MNHTVERIHCLLVVGQPEGRLSSPVLQIEGVPLGTRSEINGFEVCWQRDGYVFITRVPLVRCFGRANKSAAEAADLSALLRSELQMRRELHGASSLRGGVDLLVPRAECVGLPGTLTLADT